MGKATKGTVRFWFRFDKKLKDDTCPIYLVYQISGQRKNYLTSTRLFPCNWDNGNQMAVFVSKAEAKKLMPAKHYEFDFPIHKEIQAINNYHSSLIKDIATIEDGFSQAGTPYTVSMVIDKLERVRRPEQVKEEKSELVTDFIQRFINDNAATKEPGTLKIYGAVSNHIQEFEKYSRKQVTFDKVDYALFNELHGYLIREKDFRTVTANKTVTVLRTLCNYAKKYNIQVNDGFTDFKVKNTQAEVIALTQSELDILLNIDLSANKRLSGVRDVFCFSCTTGLRYSDLDALGWENIKENEIRITVKKTKQKLTIPLTPIPKEILARYKDRYKPLPTISDQKTNTYLKGLCQIAGIDSPIEKVIFKGNKRVSEIHPKYELITIHTGRKTFATLSLEKGMNAEEVMKVTGHKHYQSFKRYVSITEDRKSESMHEAWG
ncbi:MAG: site-specific integrase [Chitinophagaceae bacterium]|nr:MAG: site-specific integrase [Chitinophagaceae bacterium]